jgi:Xaa-Pro aminopeptidase
LTVDARTERPARAENATALRFSKVERDRRWQRVRALMEQDGIDAIVAPPHTGHHDHFSAYGRYLAGIGGFSFEVGVVFPREGEVTAITVPDVAPQKWAAQQDWVSDIRSSGRAFGDGIIVRLGELRLRRSRMGLAGLSGVPRFADGIVPHLLYTKLAAAFPEAEFVDCTHLLDVARYVKSEEEIAFLRRSVSLAEAAIKALRNTARPGATEASAYAAALGAMIEGGSEIPAMIMWQAGPPDNLVSAGPPTLRRFEAGDFLRVEIEGRCGGYCGQVTQMMVLGSLPPLYGDMWRLQQEAVQLCCAEMRPGITLGELAERTEALAQRTPYRIRFLMHGRGLGDDAPMYVFSASDQVKRWPIEAGASFIAKPVVSRDGAADVVWGDSVVVTAKGAERLGNLEPEFMELD